MGFLNSVDAPAWVYQLAWHVAEEWYDDLPVTVKDTKILGVLEQPEGTTYVVDVTGWHDDGDKSYQTGWEVSITRRADGTTFIEEATSAQLEQVSEALPTQEAYEKQVAALFADDPELYYYIVHGEWEAL